MLFISVYITPIASIDKKNLRIIMFKEIFLVLLNARPEILEEEVPQFFHQRKWTSLEPYSLFSMYGSKLIFLDNICAYV